MSPRRITPKQRTALEAVRDGRVTYGDPHPKRLARAVENAKRRAAAGETVTASITGRGERRPVPTNPLVYAICEFMVDGVEVYGQEKNTYGSLGDRELIDARPNEDGTARVVTLTDAGREAIS